MSITKDVIRACISDKRDEITHAEVVARPFTFEEHGNYVMVGVRHAGKSYLLYQRVKELQAQGIGWDEILFVDFEDERLIEMTADDLNLLLETHLETYGKKPYVFFDEIQNIAGWEKFLRRLANAKYRIYVTGSNAKMLSKEVASTLGGRFLITEVFPYSFSEYLAANHVDLPDSWEHSTEHKSKVIGSFNEFLHFGGLPEINLFVNKRAMLSSLYSKIYLGDICARHSLQNNRALNLMIKKLAECVQQPVSFNRLKNTLAAAGCNISIPSIADYIEYAIESRLILPLDNERSKFAEKETNKKYYFIDNGILALFLLHPNAALLENAVALQLIRTYGIDKVAYYKNSFEVDFVVPEQKLAVQVAYTLSDESTRKREVGALQAFAKTHPDWQLLIITYDERGTIPDTPIAVDAAWHWLLT